MSDCIQKYDSVHSRTALLDMFLKHVRFVRKHKIQSVHSVVKFLKLLNDEHGLSDTLRKPFLTTTRLVQQSKMVI